MEMAGNSNTDKMIVVMQIHQQKTSLRLDSSGRTLNTEGNVTFGMRIESLAPGQAFGPHRR